MTDKSRKRKLKNLENIKDRLWELITLPNTGPVAKLRKRREEIELLTNKKTALEWNLRYN